MKLKTYSHIILIFLGFIGFLSLVFLAQKDQKGFGSEEPQLLETQAVVDVNPVSFTFNWSDNDTERNTFYVCKSPATSTGGCDEMGEWSSATSSGVSNGVIEAKYNIQTSERGKTHNYYSFFCSSEGNETVCTDPQPGTFLVEL